MSTYAVILDGQVVHTIDAETADQAFALWREKPVPCGELWVKVGGVVDYGPLLEMARAGLAVFTVTVEALTRGVRVKVDAGDPGYAEVHAPDLETGLRMALPYMLGVADPMECAFRLPPAPGSPPDMGGAS